MILFLDTSALVKLYIAEPGSEAMRRRVSNELIAVSQLAYAEAHATFARRWREDLLTADELQILIANFEHDWQTVLQIPISEHVLPLVRDLCRDHPLRGADALQLADGGISDVSMVTPNVVWANGLPPRSAIRSTPSFSVIW